MYLPVPVLVPAPVPVPVPVKVPVPLHFMARSMARSVTAANGGTRWTPVEAAEFAAQREFRLLQLLSKDRCALAVAVRLGTPAAAFQHWHTARTLILAPVSGAVRTF